MSEVPIGGAHHTAQSILLEELTQGRPICVRCGSSSMQPKIVPGDMLTIAPVSLDQMQRGDIVLMGAGEEWFVHRLLAIREKDDRQYAVTRGDNVNRLDTPVLLECILGKVTGIRRNDEERILKSTCLQRLKARLTLVTIQVLDLLRRIKNSRWLIISHLREMGLWVAMLSFPSRVKAWGKPWSPMAPPEAGKLRWESIPPLSFPRKRESRVRRNFWIPDQVGNDRKCLVSPDPLRWLFHPDKKPDSDELLLQCSLPAMLPACSATALQAGLPAQDNSAALLQNIKTTVGWERFVKIADVEGLSELIYYNCREQITHGLIPSEACRSLENAYLTTLARNTIFLAKKEKIAHALVGLDFIVLKGAYLASHVYASPGLRRFSDIDILVKRADLAEIDLRLAAIGYQHSDCIAGPRGNGKIFNSKGRANPPGEPIPHGRLGGDASPYPEQFSVRSSFLNSVMYYPAGNEIAIDVHWHLLNSTVSNYINTTMDISEIWKAARPSQPGALLRRSRPRPSTSAGLELCPEHLLVHLAEHALHHSFERLILLRDIAEVIIRFGDALDWNRLVGECRKFNLARPVFYSLLFISRKTSVPIPAAVLDALRPARLGRAEKMFISFTLRGQRYPESCYLAYFDNMASCWEKVRFVLRLAFPCREVMALTYSKRAHEIGPGVYILRLSHGIGYVTRAMVYHALRVVHFICRRTKRASGIQSAGLI